MTAPIVRAAEVCKSYGDQQVLRGISLEVAQGRTACLIGPSGSGKSTFLRCINNLETISYGRIWVHDELVGFGERDGRLQPLKHREDCRRRARIGMVFQDFNLFGHYTALQNVMAGPMIVKHETRSDVHRRATTLLDRVGLGDKIDNYPRTLSGGQQQRVAIARALAMQPELILFDEPTSALDPELVGEVLDVIRDLAADGMSMIIVTHELGFAREVADDLIFMADGVVVESGPPGRVIDAPEHHRTQDFLAKVI